MLACKKRGFPKRHFKTKSIIFLEIKDCVKQEEETKKPKVSAFMFFKNIAIILIRT